MKFFLDSANLDEIRLASRLGIIDGITTNPSLIAKEGRILHEQIAAICDLFEGPVSAEVVETDARAMVQEGRSLARVHSNVIVKCPLTRDGIEACSRLTKEGIRVNVTLCFSAAQALVAAKAGAWFISPFVGRLDDIGQDGIGVVRQTVAIYKNFGIGTEVLAASLRGPRHVVEAAVAGAHIGTMPFKVMDSLFNHPLTEKGLEQFLSDYHKVFSEVAVGHGG
jgi:transaldolase